MRLYKFIHSIFNPFTKDKDTIKVFSGGRHTEIKKNPKTALLKIIKVILKTTAIL